MASQATAVLRPGGQGVRPIQLVVLLFAVVAGFYLLSGPTYFPYDGEIMYQVTRSLVVNHSITIVDPVMHINQPYSPYGIAVSLLLTPFFWVGWVVFHQGRVLITLFGPCVTALTVVALVMILVELGRTWRQSLAIALLYAFGSLAWFYSGQLYSEPLVALAATGSFLFLLRFRRTGQRLALLAAGGCAGLALMARLDAALLDAFPLTCYGAYLLYRRRSAWTERAIDAVAYATPLAAAAGINLAYDLMRYAGPLRGPYAVDELGFSTPLFKGLYGLLLSPGVGLLVYMPVLLLAPVGYVVFFRRWRAEAILVLALFLVRLVFYSRWWAWYAGASWGTRYLVPVVPLLMVALAFVPRERWLRALMVELGAIGVLVELLGQFVPYNQFFYDRIAPRLDVLFDTKDMCANCATLPGLGSRAVDSAIALNWQLSPLVGQFVLFVQYGVLNPALRAIWFILPVAVVGLLVALLRLRAIAGSLDRRSAAGPKERKAAA